MPRVYKKKNLRTAWPEGVLSAAIKAVRKENMSVNATAREFKIPRRTLRDRLHRGTTTLKSLISISVPHWYTKLSD